MKRLILRWLAILITCLLTSCIDGREEYWFNAMGGGHAELTYSLPAAAADLSGGEASIREKIEAYLKDNEAFTSSSYTVTRMDSHLVATVKVEFRSVKDLKKLANRAKESDAPSSARHFMGDINLEVKGLLVDFTRKISPARAIPGALFLPRKELDGHRLLYIAHLPIQPLESNATRTEDAGRTLIWDIPLSQALRGPFLTHFKARIPLPRWLLPGLFTLLLLAGLGIWKWRKKSPRQLFKRGGGFHPPCLDE